MCNGMSPVEKLEKHFGKSLERILEENHLNGVPMLRLCDEASVVRQSILLEIRKRGLRTLTRAEVEAFIDRSGPNSAWYKKKNPAASKRMKEHNPSRIPEVRERMSVALADRFRANPLPQEKKFAAMGKRFGLITSSQVPLGPYIIDFVSGSTCIEIDSTSKWGTTRRKAACRKDKWLKAKGFKVVRINKLWLSDSRRIREILLANYLISHE